MKLFKRIFAFIISAALVLPFSGFVSFADYDNGWIYIDGENINRQLNMAVVYYDVKSTGQNHWGYDVVINSDGEVTQIIEGGETEGGNLAVPEGGMVVSAGGTKIDWFKDNVSVGDTVFYDGYTQRFFVRDYYGYFDPYFTQTFEIYEYGGEYILSDGENSSDVQYAYKAAVNADGVIVSRGNGTVAPEDGFVVSAATAESMEKLVSFAVVGGECTVSDGFVTFKFDDTMLSRSASMAISQAKQLSEKLKSEYAYIETEVLDNTIAEAESEVDGISSYRSLSNLLTSLERDVEALSSDNGIYEFRGAFHVPDEVNSTEVSATVLAAKAAGLNSIILRVTNGYNTFIPMPEGNKFKQDEKFGGFDVLQSFIDVCKKENISLTLCIETYYNEYASIASPDWLSASNGSEAGLSGKYFSPASADFKSYFVDYVKYIITHYDIDSLMFDYLRYPKFNETSDLGYDYNTLQAFANQQMVSMAEVESLKTQLDESPYWDKWVAFKTSLVDDMAKTLSETVRSERSDITLTAVAERDMVDYYYMQNAVGWVEQGWFDGLTVAVYEADTDENDKLPDNSYYSGIVAEKMENFLSEIGEDAYLFAALESSSSLDVDALQSAISDVRTTGADGFVFGSLSDFIGQNYHLALEDNLLKGKSVSPLGNTAVSMKEILQYSKLKINDAVLKAGGCDDETASKANGLIDNGLTLLESGALDLSQAQELESGMLALFAESPAKDAVMKEYFAITKLARLAKEDIDFQPPSDGQDGSSDTSSDLSGDASEEVQSGSQGDESADSHVSSDRLDVSFDFGTVLIYAFVALTFAAVVAAAVVGICRKNKRPANAHMPKGSREGYENKKDDGKAEE